MANVFVVPDELCRIRGAGTSNCTQTRKTTHQRLSLESWSGGNQKKQMCQMEVPFRTLGVLLAKTRWEGRSIEGSIPRLEINIQVVGSY